MLRHFTPKLHTLTGLAAILVCVLSTFADGAAVGQEAQFSPAQIEFFESKVRPLLAEHCYECHSERAKGVKGGLRLDARALAVKGGESGASIVPGKPAESLLIEAVRWESYEMPPEGKLSDEQVSALVKWVEMGAPWPAGQEQPAEQGSVEYDWEKLPTQHWAWQPVIKPPVPTVKDAAWPLNEIDHFVLARLEATGLDPAPPAEPRTLIRRMYFDLIGLPPTPEEVEQFVDATGRDRQRAVAQVVERLLASPHYGERWGRHWLDVARYSDGHGGFLDNTALPHAWRYRDWVVSALNDDLPYDQFVRMQIAGDLMEVEGGAVATGFFALGPTYRSDGGDPDSVAQAKSATLDDRVDTLCRGFLALTVACARCHEHKFDPIPQPDYYSLAGVFNNTNTREAPLAPPDEVKKFHDHQKTIGELDKQTKQRQNELKKANRQPNDEEKKQLEDWAAELDRLKKSAPPKFDVAHALGESGNRDMKVAIRGDLRKPGDDAPRRFLRILAGADPQRFTNGSGRIELAEAVAAAENPLTARVFVNRVWMHHFGKALLRTPSNFGTHGEKPTHPQLLDWLADRFVESGWSLKQLHRDIMRSATYQMSSRFDAHNFDRDGDNRLLWRMNPRRLDVEAWRDAMLAATGELDPALGGPPTDQLESRRRTLYFQVSRNGDRFASDEFLRVFDFPIMRATVAKRPTSIVPQQYLFMLNSTFMVNRAKALAGRLEREANDDEQRVALAYQLLYGRSPTEEEQQVGLDFVRGLDRSDDKDQSNDKATDAQAATEQRPPALPRWIQYAQVLLSSNEFMYVQ